jgi:hypothetical protein
MEGQVLTFADFGRSSEDAILISFSVDREGRI